MSADGFTYVLVMKDDFSGFVHLVSAKEAAANALMNWFSQFGYRRIWVSDRGSHFKNQIMDALSDSLGIQHKFTTAYVPWSNGTVERVNRTMEEALRALLSERRLRTTAWPALLPSVQASINHTPTALLGGRAPVTVFTGLPASRPLDLLLSDSGLQSSFPRPTSTALANKVAALESALQEMHKAVAASKNQNRARNREQRLNSSKTFPYNFHLGDFVMVANNLRQPRGKLEPRWTGPARITGIVNEWIYKIAPLAFPRQETNVHAERLRFFHDSTLNSSAVLQHSQYLRSKFPIDELLDIKLEDGTYYIKVSWSGFDPADSTWEDIAVICADVPSLMRLFITNKLPKLEHVSSSLRDGFTTTVLSHLEGGSVGAARPTPTNNNSKRRRTR